jgi:hypothetical protein
MKATHAIKMKGLRVPLIEPLMPKTQAEVIIVNSTAQAIDIALPKQEYTDQQFHADLKKAGKRLDAMVAEALEEDAQGKTRKFPV